MNNSTKHGRIQLSEPQRFLTPFGSAIGLPMSVRVRVFEQEQQLQTLLLNLTLYITNLMGNGHLLVSCAPARTQVLYLVVCTF